MISIDRGLYVSASGMMVGEKKLDDIANNISNINTAGYKKDTSIIKEFSKLLETNLKSGQNIGTLSNQVCIDDTYTQFQNGAVNQTNINTDFAINGDGFFKIQKDNKYLYTRAGNFKIDEQGYLVTSDGGYVMNKNNEKIKFDPKDIYISQNMMIVDFNNKQTLAKLDNNYFENKFNLSMENPVQKADVKQGMLEMSNVDAAQEMTDLLKTQRYFQSNQKAIMVNDSLLEKISQF